MESPAQPTNSELATKIDHLIFGLKLGASVLLIFLTIPAFLSSLTIPYFQQVYQDALPGKPLPSLTMFIIGLRHYLPLPLLTLVWPVIGITNIAMSKSLPWWIISTATIAGIIVMQWFLTWIGLFLPMTDLFVGMSDMPSH
jgi:hypothetical protein